MANDCPQCGLLNPPSAQRCDCGYDLVKRPTPSVTPMTAHRLMFSFEGRIGRYWYWLFFLPYMAASGALLWVDGALGTLGVISGVFVLLTLYPSIAVGVKRCHDRDHSGWYVLLGIIPVVNLWLLVELGFLPGAVGPNRFGLPEPSRG